MDVECDSELNDTQYEEIDNSDTIRPYMYEPIPRERDEDFLMTLIFRFLLLLLFNDNRMFWERVKYFVFSFPTVKMQDPMGVNFQR